MCSIFAVKLKVLPSYSPRVWSRNLACVRPRISLQRIIGPVTVLVANESSQGGIRLLVWNYPNRPVIIVRNFCTSSTFLPCLSNLLPACCCQLHACVFMWVWLQFMSCQRRFLSSLGRKICPTDCVHAGVCLCLSTCLPISICIWNVTLQAHCSLSEQIISTMWSAQSGITKGTSDSLYVFCELTLYQLISHFEMLSICHVCIKSHNHLTAPGQSL